MKFSIFIALIFSFTLVTSCKIGSSLTPEEYLKWCSKEKSNFSVKDTVDQVVYNFTHVSNEEDAANCLLSSCLTEDEIKKELNENNTNQQFKLRIQVIKPGYDIFSYSLPNYNSPIQNRQKYLAFEMKQDLYLVTKMGDTIACNYWFYEPSVVGSGFANIECSFKPISRNEMKSIVYNDICFTGKKIEILVDEFPFSSYPTLKIKSIKK